ncbi:S8/S53 family peptidase [Chitinophagaceae bacterium 26-R-25]|nr:S8/S53 family peptidase [Chitinophagaceae bacterium 26-R-25]
MTQLKVIVPILNIRKAPVEDFSDKSNVVAKLFNGAPFITVKEKINKLGKWYQNEKGYWAWEVGLGSPSATDKPIPDLQSFLNSCFDGQTLKSEINYGALLEMEDAVKLTSGQNVTIGILDHPMSTSIQFNNPVTAPFHVNDPLFNFHANFIAGIIAGTTGVIGFANKCRLVELPIYNARASSSGIDINAVLQFINRDDAPMIVNISNKLDAQFNDTIKNFRPNKIVVAAAGIDEQLCADTIRDPASLENVIAVGAITKPMSNLPKLNSKVDFVLPNFNFVSYSKASNLFAQERGDSFACAVVSGIIALLISSGKVGFDRASIKNALNEIAFPSSVESFNSLNLINVMS